MEPSQRANMAFAGIATFAKLPFVADYASAGADAVIIGVPYDAGIGFRPGTRFGPRAIREMSTRYAFGEVGGTEKGYFDIDTRTRYLEWPKMVDGGDVDVLYLDTQYTFDQITNSVSQAVNSGAIPVVLGGDHSVTYPVIRGLASRGPFGIVHLDAHLDFKDSVMGVKLGNSSPIRRASELPFVTNIVSIGSRGIRTSETDLNAAEKNGNVIVPATRIWENGLGAALSAIPLCDRFYITVDIDVLDPSLAPGTGSPEADGLPYRWVKRIIQEVALKAEIVGFDVVEVNPYLDPTQVTQLVAARLVIETLGLAFAGRSGQKRQGVRSGTN